MVTPRDEASKIKGKKDKSFDNMQPESLSPEPLRESNKKDQGKRSRKKSNVSKGTDGSQEISPDRSKTWNLNQKLKIKELAGVKTTTSSAEKSESARITKRISSTVNKMMTDRPSSRGGVTRIIRAASR
jgi:hypothetical protein